jgi:formamidopyrimidine-DNA glycosylase
VRVESRRPDLRFAFPARFVERLVGATVESLDRRAKYLIAYLSTDEALIMHLGMSGRFSIVDERGVLAFDDYAYDTGADPKHDHVVLHVGTGAKVIYNDPRRFGFMDIVPTAGLEQSKHFAKMGPEPLGNHFSADHLAEALATKKTLLQHPVVGILSILARPANYVLGLRLRAVGKPPIVLGDPVVPRQRTTGRKTV